MLPPPMLVFSLTIGKQVPGSALIAPDPPAFTGTLWKMML